MRGMAAAALCSDLEVMEAFVRAQVAAGRDISTLVEAQAKSIADKLSMFRGLHMGVYVYKVVVTVGNHLSSQ